MAVSHSTDEMVRPLFGRGEMTETELIANLRSLPERRRELVELVVKLMAEDKAGDFRVSVRMTHETEGAESVYFE